MDGLTMKPHVYKSPSGDWYIEWYCDGGDVASIYDVDGIAIQRGFVSWAKAMERALYPCPVPAPAWATIYG